MSPKESPLKALSFPGLSDSLRDYWRGIADTVAELLDVPIVLVQRVHESKLELLVANSSAGNLFHAGQTQTFTGTGIYCETVVRTFDVLCVDDASQAAEWSGKIAVNQGMTSYLGFPIAGPQGELFGTFCILSDKPRQYSSSQRRMVEQYRDLIEHQLKQAQVDVRAGHWRYSFDLLQAVIDGATDAIFLKDLDGRFLLFNQAASNFTGHRIEDVVGATTEEVFGEIIGKQLLEYDLAVVRSGQPHTVKENIWMQGSPRVFLTTRSPYQDETGNIIGIIGIARDITETQRVEEELRIERERLALVAKVCELGIWDYDIGSNKLLCDAQWNRILGLDGSRKIESVDEFKAYIHPDDVIRATEVNIDELNELMAQDQCYRVDYRIFRADGVMRWVRSATVLLQGESGEPYRAVGMIMDITEARLAEEQLRSSFEFLQRAEKLARIGSWVLDLGTGEFSASDMLYELSGVDPSAPPLTVPDLQNIYAPESYQKVSEAINTCIATGKPYGLEVEHLGVNGPSFPVYMQGQAHRDDAGRITHLSGTVQDITEITEARRQLAAVTDNLPNGAIYRIEFDRHGQAAIVFISAGISALIGVPAEEIIADTNVFLRMIHEEDRPRYYSVAEQARLTQQPSHCRFRVNARNGKIVWLEYRGVMSAKRADGSTVWDGIIQDITREQEAAEALRAAKDIAEKAEQAKGEFLATMSHEIRTPMNTVIGMTRLMLQTDLTPKQRNYLKKVDASAKLLLSIINDILDFSKIEAGCLELEITDFTLESVLESVSAATAPRAEEKGIEIAYEIKPTVLRSLKGDPLRLCQVLINLIGNAVKFTDKGEIIVTVDTQMENGCPMLHFTVRDTGIGMEPHQIEGLFRPFSQAAPQTSRHYGGTGLGLTISKHIVESMGGAIGVQSEPGKGSTFHFAIPQDNKCLISPDQSSYSPRELNGRRVLIIDDNASARRILMGMVEGFGIEAQATDSGESGLKLLREAATQGRPFDLVLLDWQMPAMDGLETARRIREEENLQRMPAVLMVTAYAREEVQQGVEALGLQGLLAKPITESVLFNGILDALLHPDPITLYGDVKTGTQIRPEIAPPGTFELLDGRCVLVVDDNALNREVASDFLLAAGMQVDTAVDGLDALHHLEQKDYDAVLMDIHMPTMDGLTATRQIRRHQRWANLPIIALTAQARIEDREASLNAGMTGYLTKPIDETALYDTLARIFVPTNIPVDSRDAVSNQAFTSLDSHKLRSPQQGDFDLDAALKRLGNNPQRLRRLLQGFLADFADMPEQMEHHLQARDTEQIAQLAHLAKGTAGYLEAHEFCSLAEQLEQAGRQGDISAIDQHGPRFVQSLRKLLAQLNEITLEQAPAQAPDMAQALQLVEQVQPLAQQGEYAANALLDQIDLILRNTELAGLVSEVLSHYENLELELTVTALKQLKNKLEQELKQHE